MLAKCGNIVVPATARTTGEQRNKNLPEPRRPISNLDRPEVATYLGGIGCLSLVLENHSTWQDAQPIDLGEIVDNRFRKTVAEVVQLGVVAGVLKWKNRNGINKLVA
jgi:hypothetical protein